MVGRTVSVLQWNYIGKEKTTQRYLYFTVFWKPVNLQVKLNKSLILLSSHNILEFNQKVGISIYIQEEFSDG